MVCGECELLLLDLVGFLVHCIFIHRLEQIRNPCSENEKAIVVSVSVEGLCG